MNRPAALLPLAVTGLLSATALAARPVANPDGHAVGAVAWSTVQAPVLERVRWLAGCWQLERGARRTVEMWMPPEGTIMLGASRTTVSGVLREHEQLALEVREGRLRYIARPSGQGETIFTSTEVSDSGFTVENLGHDFPQRIIYRRGTADSMTARIEGPGPAGPRSLELRMQRMSCRAP